MSEPPRRGLSPIAGTLGLCDAEALDCFPGDEEPVASSRTSTVERRMAASDVRRRLVSSRWASRVNRSRWAASSSRGPGDDCNITMSSKPPPSSNVCGFFEGSITLRDFRRFGWRRGGGAMMMKTIMMIMGGGGGGGGGGGRGVDRSHLMLRGCNVRACPIPALTKESFFMSGERAPQAFFSLFLTLVSSLRSSSSS